jgi:hypothetical protein
VGTGEGDCVMVATLNWARLRMRLGSLAVQAMWLATVALWIVILALVLVVLARNMGMK